MKDKKAFKPCDLIIFGALGDLSRRKLLISLYRLEKSCLIEPDTRIIGVDRHPEATPGFAQLTHTSLQEFLNEEIDDTVWGRFSALRPITISNAHEKTVRGQYPADYLKGNAVPGYLEEEGANKESTTESFVALRVDIDNWRWADVPFYLRTGKRMNNKRTEIVVYFKQLPHNIFKDSYRDLPPNRLIIQLQPNEGVEIEMLNKIPGIDEHIKIQKTKLDLSFSETFKKNSIFGGYEKLILEALRGNSTLSLSREEIEQAWTWIDSIQDVWAQINDTPKLYPAGSWGPIASVALLARDGGTWEE